MDLKARQSISFAMRISLYPSEKRFLYSDSNT